MADKEAGGDGGLLSSRELAALTAICDTLMPGVAGEEPAALFRARGSDLGVPRLMGEAVATLPDRAQRDQFRQLLGIFEHRLANLLLAGRCARFSELPDGARESYLLSWAHSGFGQRRMGFQVLKRLACFLFYSVCDGGSNPVWPAIGYPVPISSAPSRPREIRTIDVAGETNLAADVCVIGSGAGGAVVSVELAAAGAQGVRTLDTLDLRWRQEQGEAGLRALGAALGREGVRANRLLLFSAHLMGTCRMGGDPDAAVVNPEGEVYGVRGLFVADGSVFPSASGVNPMITIMGLAHRTAQFMKARI